MPYCRVTTEVKQAIIDAYENHEDYLEAARPLQLKRTTAYGIVRRWKEKGIFQQRGGGVRIQRVKVDEEMKNAAIAIVEAHSAFTLKQILEELQRRLLDKPPISITTLAKLLDGQLITMKKLEDIPIDRNRIDVKNDRREYARWLTTEALNENLIYVDECGFNLFTQRTRRRARIGQRAVRQVLNTTVE